LRPGVTAFYSGRMRGWVALLALASLAAGGTDEGKAALANKDYERALELFEEAGEAGDAEAQFQAGELYRQGLGMRRPKRRSARKWYENAHTQGHARAAGELGIALWDGRRKRDQAMKLIRKGVEAGHARSAYYIAVLSLRDREARILDPEDIVRFLKLAAKKGHPDAQLRYALRFERDRSAAERLIRRAVAQEHPKAFLVLAGLVEPGGARAGSSDFADLTVKGALRGDVRAQWKMVEVRLARGAAAEAHAWAYIVLSPKFSLPEEDERPENAPLTSP